MIFLPKHSKDFNTTYLELLLKYTQMEKYNDIQVVYLTKSHSEKLNIDILPKMLTKDNKDFISLQEISNALLKDINMEDSLIGGDEENINLCNKFFELVNLNRNDCRKFCEILERELSENTFLNNSANLKICDLYCFSFLYFYFAELEDEMKREIPNCYRWFNYLQNMMGIKEMLELKNMPQMEEIQFHVPPKKKKTKHKKQKKNCGKNKNQNQKQNQKKNQKNNQQKNQQQQKK